MLYAEKRGLGRYHHVTITLSPMGKVCIEMWKCMLVLLQLRPRQYARPLESFRRGVRPRFQIEYDGCPYGCGVIIRDLTVGTELNTLSGLLLAGGLKFPFDLTNPATGKMDSRSHMASPHVVNVLK